MRIIALQPNSVEKNIKKLERKINQKQEEKHFSAFETQCVYLNNGIYAIAGTNVYSTDTRELMLMFVANREEIPYVFE